MLRFYLKLTLSKASSIFISLERWYVLHVGWAKGGVRLVGIINDWAARKVIPLVRLSLSRLPGCIICKVIIIYYYYLFMFRFYYSTLVFSTLGMQQSMVTSCCAAILYTNTNTNTNTKMFI